MGFSLSKPKSKPLLMMLGLDDSGKTTLFYKLIDQRNTEAPGPTNGLNLHHLTLGGRETSFVEMGGAQRIRVLWLSHLPKVSVLIWVIDGQNRDRFEESKESLLSALGATESEAVPLLVIVNKADDPNSMQKGDVIEGLALRSLGTRPWTCLACDAVTGAGIQDLLDHMALLAAPKR